MVKYEIYASLRDKANLNDCKVSKIAEIPRSTISEWKRGRSTPKLENLTKIASAIGVKLNDLIGADV